MECVVHHAKLFYFVRCRLSTVPFLVFVCASIITRHQRYNALRCTYLKKRYACCAMPLLFSLFFVLFVLQKCCSTFKERCTIGDGYMYT